VSNVHGFVLTVAVVLFGGLLAQAAEPEAIALLPQPLHVVRGSGAFVLNKDVTIRIDKDSPDAANVAGQLAMWIRRGTGLRLAVVPSDAAGVPQNAILLMIKTADAALGAEGYSLEVSPAGVVICAAAGPGLFYGTQTLLQLLPPQVFCSTKPQAPPVWAVPAVRIEDRPRFPWRGLVLDSARHFFTVEEIENFIDLMVQHKLNVLHWHLTDDVGWRLEIKRYPKLTQIGAWRKGILFGLNPKDSTAWGADGRYGGFYSQDEVRRLVAYAKDRYVRIMPEIEMPGHIGAALAAYPEYGCTGRRFDPDEGARKMGICCAGNDATYEFIEGILSEVLDLFPSKFIHVGGDEVGKEQWKACPKCQARIRREGLKDECQLESYFIRRIEKFLNARKRTLIGWDEILEGGLAPNAAVMSWRGAEGGIAAANAGHDVLMTPFYHCYFDLYQAASGEPKAIGGFVPLERVYAFEPVPPGLAAGAAKHILGSSGNLWSEYFPNYAHVQYMAYPRACAMAEVTWSDPKHKNWDDFRRRLDVHLRRLKAEGVNYRPPRPNDSQPPKSEPK
jgi:hexosaminidase